VLREQVAEILGDIPLMKLGGEVVRTILDGDADDGAGDDGDVDDDKDADANELCHVY
jgi:hypothetical protein